jgi:urease beta subunit
LAFILHSTNGSVRYSPGEQQLFKLLPTNGKPLTTAELTKLRYGSIVPLNGQKIILGLVKSLRTKVDLNKEPFRVFTSKRSGPRPISVWVQGRTR